MTQLEARLDALRPSAASKPKFSFKRKTVTTHTRDVTSPATPITTPSSQAAQPVAEPTEFHTLVKHSHAHLTRSSLPPAQTGDLTIAGLHHCLVDLCTLTHVGGTGVAHLDEWKPTALHIRDLRDCVILLPPVNGSVLVHDLERCIIAVACHQVRFLFEDDAKVIA